MVDEVDFCPRCGASLGPEPNARQVEMQAETAKLLEEWGAVVSGFYSYQPRPG